MKCYSKIILFAMFALVTASIFGPIASGAGVALFQSESAAQDEEQASSPEYIEQYDAWEKADKEPDLLKRGTLLTEFISKYPKSELMPNIKASYKNAMMECDNSGKYQELETLAEQWLKLYPGDLDGLALVVKATEKLGHNEKWIQSLLEIYKIRTTGAIANEIARAYKKANNNAKYIEWTETALKYPEFEGDFMTRLTLMQYYIEQKNLSRALEYAQATLKSVDAVKNPSADTKAAITKVRLGCLDAMGKIQMEQDNFPKAIQSFRQALDVEKTSEDYYYIALCLHKQDRVDDAMLWYARAEQQGGDYATKAKETLEQMYKAIHNNTLVGIEKLYRRAKEQPEIVEALAKDK